MYISIGMTDTELDRFVDLCCHHDDGPITEGYEDPVFMEDHGLHSLGLIYIMQYHSPYIVEITDHGREIFKDLKEHDPISLIKACIRQAAWNTASYFVWALLSASQLPEFLTHDNKEIRDLAAKRLDLLTTCRRGV